MNNKIKSVTSLVSMLQHPNWTNSGAVGFPYDLAVMMMNMSAKVESPYIQPIPLPEPGTRHSGSVQRQNVLNI